MSGWLKLHVVKGRKLAAMDSNGLSDPFMSVSIDRHSAPMKTVDGKQVVTPVKKLTLNPVWNAEFTVLVWQKTGVLWLDVWDKDTFGEDEFMGRAEVVLGVGSEEGSCGEKWFTLKPREGNATDEDKYRKHKNSFGEVYVKWQWVYSHVGQLLTASQVDGPEIDWTVRNDLDWGILNKQIARTSAWGYSLCLPWFWLCEKFMWEKPFESLFVLYLVNVVVYYDMLSELFFGTLVAIMLARWFDRARYGYYGPPQPPEKVYNDPFEWMRDTNTQLNYSQLLCAWYSDQFDWFFEIMTWDRYDEALLLTKCLGAWTVLAYFGLFPPMRYVFLAAMWFMFTLYPMMWSYPKGYKATIAALCDPVGSVTSAASGAVALWKGEPGAGTESPALGAGPTPPPSPPPRTPAAAPAPNGHANGAAPAAPTAVKNASGAPLAPLAANCKVSLLEVCGAAAPYAGLPGPVRRVLEMNQCTAWSVVKQDREMTYENTKFDFCPINAVRVRGMMKVTTTQFAKFITDEANSRKYDELMTGVRVVEERPSGGKCLHATFKAPSFLVTARDMSTFSISSLLPTETIAHFGLKCDASVPPPPTDLSLFHQHAGVFVSGGMSIVHEKAPEQKGYVRGCVHGFGWIVEPVAADTAQVTFILAMSPNGSIPKSVVEIANAAQVNKWRSVKKLLKA